MVFEQVRDRYRKFPELSYDRPVSIHGYTLPVSCTRGNIFSGIMKSLTAIIDKEIMINTSVQVHRRKYHLR